MHTPGPWIAWDDGRGIGIDDGLGNPIQIAEVVDGADMASEDQLLSDQRLIAAAPDMLAALEKVEGWLARREHPDTNPQLQVYAYGAIDTIIAAAIAKARGA